MGRVREEKRREEERRSEKRKNQKKEDAGARKRSNVVKHCVFSKICASRRSKSRLTKAAGAEPSGQMRDEKLHAVVALSTFRRQKCKKLAVSEHFFEVRMRFCVAGARDSAPCQKAAKRDGSVYNSFKHVGRHGTVEEDLQRCISAQYKRHVHQTC